MILNKIRNLILCIKQNNKSRYIMKEILLFLIGGCIYVTIEVFMRDFSHWTMFILGGICFVFLGLINELFTWKTPIWLQSLIGGIMITTLEFITGCIVNLKLDWNIWDYSDRFCNLKGQICLQNSCYWIILACVGIVLDDLIRYKLFDEEKPHYVLL